MSASSYTIGSTLVLLGILILIPLSLWIVKKSSFLGRGTARSLRLVESMAVGPRERLVVIHTGNQYLLIGCTGQQISLLNELNDYIEKESEKGFGKILEEAGRNGRK